MSLPIRQVLFVFLLLMVACGSNSVPPEVALVSAPEIGQTRTPYELVWEISIPEEAIAMGQFTLHVDDRSHKGSFGKSVDPILAGYKRVIEEPISLIGDGRFRLTYTLEEMRPIQLYYRFHLTLDGSHYWSPERILTIVPRPAFPDDFRESLMEEAFWELSLF